MRPVRLRTVLLGLNLVVLALPIAGLVAFRVYEDQLVLGTEENLIGQCAIIAAAAEASTKEPGSCARSEAEPRYELLKPRLHLAKARLFPEAPAPQPTETKPAPRWELVSSRLSRLLKESQRTTLAGYRLVDEAGVVVASSRGDIGTSLANRVEIRDALQGKPVSLLRRRGMKHKPPPLSSVSRAARVRVWVALPIKSDGTVIGAVLAGRTPIALRQALYEIRGRLALWLSLTILLAAALALAISHFVARPLREIASQAGLASEGNAVSPIPHPRTREVAELTIALSEMSRRMKRRADYLQNFAASVSHQFKSPLTSILGAVELLSHHEMAREDQTRFLSNLEGDARRLDRMVRRLSDYTRAEMMSPSREAVSIASVLHQMAEPGIELNIADSLPNAAIDEEILLEVIESLVDNAKQHGGEDCAIIIGVHRDGEELRIDVQDDGPGVPEELRGQIFDPFVTTTPGEGGSGLGLAIARKLVEAHGGRLDLIPSERGACFRVSLNVDAEQEEPKGPRTSLERW